MTFPAKSVAWMQARALAFQKGTQRRGMPMTYGKGEVPKPKKPKR